MPQAVQRREEGEGDSRKSLLLALAQTGEDGPLRLPLRFGTWSIAGEGTWCFEMS